MIYNIIEEPSNLEYFLKHYNLFDSLLCMSIVFEKCGLILFNCDVHK